MFIPPRRVVVRLAYTCMSLGFCGIWACGLFDLVKTWGDSASTTMYAILKTIIYLSANEFLVDLMQALDSRTDAE